jgi:hypothetical protein
MLHLNPLITPSTEMGHREPMTINAFASSFFSGIGFWGGPGLLSGPIAHKGAIAHKRQEASEGAQIM